MEYLITFFLFVLVIRFVFGKSAAKGVFKVIAFVLFLFVILMYLSLKDMQSL